MRPVERLYSSPRLRLKHPGSVGLMDAEFGEGNTSARGTHEVGTAIRGGRVAGEHTVYFLGDSERLELTHRATDRDLCGWCSQSGQMAVRQKTRPLLDGQYATKVEF